jgi:integrase
MAKAKKLPSGSWRCQAYSHTEPQFDKDGKSIIDPKTNKPKMKRIYESFTSNDPSMRGKREAELMAAEFQATKDTHSNKKRINHGNMTLTEGIDKYIESRIILNRSPATIQEYRCTQKYGFQDMMDMQLKDFDEDILQEAINMEAQRQSQGRNKKKVISAKRLKNEWGLISAVLKKYCPGLEYSVELPPVKERVPELLPAKTVIDIVKGTEIELAVLLAAWLSFSMSEVRGLTKSKSISNNQIRIAEVVIDVNGEHIRKDIGKNECRNRTHQIPTYIKQLIDKVEGDILVPMNGRVLYHRWIKLLDENNLPHMTFHDLRHLSASIMAWLRIPDKYAQERGGWKTDQVMKRVYMQTLPEERKQVDAIIDNYFENIVEPESDGFDGDKYKAWLTLFEKEDNRESKKEFLLFMQHEMQHKLKKVT